MKATITPPSEREVTLTMTETEANILRCLVGGVGTYKSSGLVPQTLHACFSALAAISEDENVESFSSYFSGQVQVLL